MYFLTPGQGMMDRGMRIVKRCLLRACLCQGLERKSYTTTSSKPAIPRHAADCHSRRLVWRTLHRFSASREESGATRSGPSGGNARRSSFWRLWALRLPHRQRPPLSDDVTLLSRNLTYCKKNRLRSMLVGFMLSWIRVYDKG